MRLDSVKAGAGSLTLFFSDPGSVREAYQLAYRFKPGDYDIRKKVKHRTGEQNRLMWAILTEMAEAVGITAEEVYRNCLRDGNAFIPTRIPAGMEKAHVRSWSQNGIGWFCVKTDYDGDYVYYNDYYGTSQFDLRQMTEFIDRLKVECDNMGLDTMDERLRSLLEAYEE